MQRVINKKSNVFKLIVVLSVLTSTISPLRYLEIKNFDFIEEVNAADTGFVSFGTEAAVTTNAGDNNGFETGLSNTPQDATTSNDGYDRDVNSGNDANAVLGCGTFPQSENDQHDFYDFSFSIPSGATIDGIEVLVEGNGSVAQGTTAEYCVGLSWNTGSNWTSAKTTGLLSNTPTDTTYYLGGATDTWGRTWSDTEFSNANFRLRVMPEADHRNADFNLDFLQAKVYYTEGSAVSISLNTNGSVGFGSLAPSASQDTTASGINDVETVSVDSGPADLDVKSTNFSDGSNTWTLGTSIGSNIVKWESSPDGSSWTTFAAADTLYALATNVSQSSTQNLYLRITIPSTTSSYSQHSSTVTIVASSP